MLNIPALIKNLYKQDGVWKNFRAHFPNGEWNDITNSDIVRESLKFTESVCSERAMTFGGCERSVVEFETVGVGNIRGAVMECSIEIDCSSLSSAQLTAVDDAAGDGTLVRADQGDLGRTVFRIPLGKFQVASCPRDHRASAHRQVTAYTPRPWRLNPVERAKLDWMCCGDFYEPAAEDLFLSLIGYNCPGFMEAQGWTRTKVFDWETGSTAGGALPASDTISMSTTLQTTDGESITISATGTRKTVRTDFNFNLGAPLLSLDLNGAPAGDIVDSVLAELDLYDIDWEASALSRGPFTVQSVDEFMRWELRDALVSMTYYDVPIQMQTAILTGDAPVIYTKGPTFDSHGAPFLRTGPGSWTLSIPESVTITIIPPSPASATIMAFDRGDAVPEIYEWSKSDQSAAVNLSIGYTGEADYTADDETYRLHSWPDAYDPGALVKGWMELNGQFLAAGRGLPHVTELSTAGAPALAPGGYADCWWSEDEPESVMQVLFTCGEDQPGSWGDSRWGSVYDMQNNVLPKLLAARTEPEVSYLVGLRMFSGLRTLDELPPAELTMPAWPWLEAGDVLAVEAEDGETAYVGIFRRAMTGVQLLMDEIEAPGGETEDDDE